MHVSAERVRTDHLCSPTSIGQHTVSRHRNVVTVPLWRRAPAIARPTQLNTQ